MIKYREENRNDITQRVEIDLTEIPHESRKDLKNKVGKYLKYKGKNIFNFKDRNKLVYETEVLIPKVNKNRLNVLMVLGNPAVHSVAERMFFSYEGAEGKWREHRFWRALRECKVLKFNSDLGKPTLQNVEKINACKRDWLLNGKYDSDFNIFLLPYFSFPTPSSTRECNGVAGIRKIVGGKIFREMKELEFRRFKGIILGNDIKNVMCFQKTNVLKEIKQRTKCEQVKSILNAPVYKIDIALKHVTLYYAGSTRLLHTDEGKKMLKGIVADIKAKNKVG